MNISNINHCMSQIATDDKACVKLAQLTGDEKMSVFAIELAAGQSIPAHYHNKDIETYFILEGQGIVRTGTLRNEMVVWNTEVEVHAGDCFTIYPGDVHEFKNNSETTLRILGTAPLSHTTHDRYFIETKEPQLQP